MSELILGGGIAGLSLASFLTQPSIILEKSKTLGGLCKSYHLNNIAYDLGPHIIFSKDKTDRFPVSGEIISLMGEG